MSKTSVFIDGFNLYHALDANVSYHKYKWLNLLKLAKCFISPKDTINDVFYFTTYTTWNQKKLARHQTYVKALQCTNVKIIFGEFRCIDITCRICHKSYKTFEEKRTDVNIAITLFQTAIKDTWDKAIIISGDSDLIPAIEALKKTFPTKEINIVIPIGRRAEELKQVADAHMKLKKKHLETCQFDDIVNIDSAHQLKRPDSWK